MELTASRALVHYDGWASRWDEWLQLDSGRITKRGESGDTAATTTKDGDSAGKRRAKSTAAGLGVGDGGDEVEWAYSRVDCAALRAGTGVGWLSHSAANSAKLEAAYQALLSSNPSSSTVSSPSLSSDSTSSSSSPSSSSSAVLSSPLLLRSARQSFDVDLPSMTQNDVHTGVQFHLKRKSALEANSFTFLEDVQCAITDQQLLCVLPAATPPNLSRRPLVRVFELCGGQGEDEGDGEVGEVRWRGDVKLLSEKGGSSLPAALSTAYVHVSQNGDAQLSSVCFDSLNDELHSFHTSEDTVRRWRNTGPSRQLPSLTPPPPPESDAEASRRDVEDEEEHRVQEADEAEDETDSSMSPASPRSPLHLVASLLSDVSACSRLQLSASAPPSSALFSPFCIDVHAATFTSLYRLISHCWHQLQSTHTTTPTAIPHTSLFLSIFVSLLHLLQANLTRLTSLPLLEPSLTLPLPALRDLLLDLSTSSPPTSLSSLWSPVRRLCVDCIVAGVSLLFPSPADVSDCLISRVAQPSALIDSRDPLLDALSTSAHLMTLFHTAHLSALASLLSALLTRCQGLAWRAIHELPPATADPPSSPSPLLLLSSPLQLLVKLQRYLFSMLLPHSGEEGEEGESPPSPPSGVGDGRKWTGQSWLGLFHHFAQQLCATAANVLERAHHCISASSSPPSISSLLAVLDRSIVGTLIPSFLVLLSSPSPTSPTHHLDLASLHKAVLPFLHQLDRFNHTTRLSEGRLTTSSSFPSSSSPSSVPLSSTSLPPEFRHTTLETPHPYTPGTIDTVLTLPSSHYLALEFDPRCTSRNLNDALKLSQGRHWSLQCSGSVLPTHGGQQNTTPRWPTWMVRRKGDTAAVYWHIDKSDHKGEKSQGQDWGFRLTMHGFHPHPVPRVTRTAEQGGEGGGVGEAMAVVLDLQFSAATVLALLARSAMLPVHTAVPVAPPSPSPRPALSAHGGDAPISAGEVDEVTEDQVDDAVDLSLLSVGLADADAESLTEEQRQAAALVEELLDGQAPVVGAVSLPPSGSSAPRPNHAPSSLPASVRSLSPTLSLPPSLSAPSPSDPSISQLPPSSTPSCTALLDVLSTHLPGRVAMSASMRRVMAPVESAMLAAFLVHTGHTHTAVALARSLTAISTAASFSLTSPLPPPPSAPSLLSSTFPLPTRRPKRSLTDTQTSLLTSLTPLWQAVHKVERWLLQQAQYDTQFALLLDDVTAEAERRSQPPPALSEPTPPYGITVASLLQAAVAANRATAAAPSEVDGLIRDRLQALPPDTLGRFCRMHRVVFDEVQVEKAVAQLARVVKRAVMAKRAKGSEGLGAEAASSLERIVLRVWNVAAFLCAFRCGEVGEAVAMAVVSRYLQAAASELTSALISRVVAARMARCAERSTSYATLAAALPLLSPTSARETLLHHLPSIPFTSQLLGCKDPHLTTLQQHYTDFIERLTELAHSQVQQWRPQDSLPLSLLDHFMDHTRCLHDAHPTSPLVAFFFTSLLAFHTQLIATARQLENPILPPPSATLLQGAAGLPPLCCYAYSGSNHVDMEIWSCRTCGFVDGKVVCRSCALSCHAGHDVLVVKQSRAFCDCFLYTGEQCKGMRWTERGRKRAVLEERGRNCVLAAVSLLTHAVERRGHLVQAESPLRLALLDGLRKEVGAFTSQSSRAAGDDEQLYRLLALVFRFRHRLFTPSTSPSSDGGWPLVEGLLRVMLGSPLRCQRLSIRLLGFLLPTLPTDSLEPKVQTGKLPTLDSCLPCPPSPLQPSVSRLPYAMVSGLMTLVGEIVLHSQLLQSSTTGSAEVSPLAAVARLSNAVAEQQVAASSALHQLVLCHSDWLPPVSTSKPDGGPFSSPSSSSSSSSSLLSFFLDRCSGDVLHYQQLQSLMSDPPTSSPPSSFSSSSTSPSPDPPKALDPFYKASLAYSLHLTSSATVFEGLLPLCEELGEKLASTGLTVHIRSRLESPVRARNLAPIRLRGRKEGPWRMAGVTGKQSLAVATELVLLLRGLLLPSASPAWASLTRAAAVANLAHLTPPQLVPVSGGSEHAQPCWSVELLAGYGALSVVVGSAGYDLPHLGSTVRVATREVAEEEEEEGVVVSSTTSSSSVAGLVSAICTPWRKGTVVDIDEGGSEVRVLFDDDPRRSCERVHWRQLQSCLPSHLAHSSVIPALGQDAAGMAATVLHALRNVSPPPPSAPSTARFLPLLLHCHLLRALTALTSDATALRLLLSPSGVDVLASVARAAVFPSIISDLRSLHHEWSRGMEAVIDLRSHPTLSSSPPTPALATHWSPSSSPHCLLSSDLLTALYCSPPLPKVRRMKVDLDQLLPTLLLADHPWSLPSPCYFEVTIRSEVKLLSIGLSPLILPPHLLPSPPSSSSSSSLSLSPSSFSSRHLFGWPEGSVLYTSEGRKARFYHAVKDPHTHALHVADLCDVRDATTGKWHAATIIGESDRSLHVHFLAWDERNDEQIDRHSDRIDTFLARSRYAHRTAGEPLFVSGQLWWETYDEAGGVWKEGDVIGCGYSLALSGVYFTRNGRWLGVAYTKDIAARMLPAVCMHDAGTQVTANFAGPFVYQGKEHMHPPPLSTQASSPSSSSSSTPAAAGMDGVAGEGAWLHGGVTDISTSLQVFNDPHFNPSTSPSIPRRLLPYHPPPSPTIYRRHELAQSIHSLHLFPDLSLPQLMLALDMADDDLSKAVEICYLQSSLLSPAPADRRGAGSGGLLSLPTTASLFSPAPRTSFASSAASSSSFFAGPFNTSSSSSSPPRPPRFSFHPPSRRSQSVSAVSVDELDAFDDPLGIDDDPSPSANLPSPPTSDAAYSLSSLSTPPRTSHDFVVHEAIELLSSSSSASSHPPHPLLHPPSHSSARLSLDPSIHPALELFGLLQERLRGQGAGGGAGQEAVNVVDLVEALRSQLVSIDPSLFARTGRPSSSSLSSPSSSSLLFPSFSSYPSSSDPSLSPHDLQPGVQVRISPHAKPLTIGRLPPPLPAASNDVGWTEDMDPTIGRVGLITAVDRSVPLCLVLTADIERGVHAQHWYPPHALVRLIAGRGWAYHAGHHPLLRLPHVVRVQGGMLRQLARRLLLRLLPHLVDLTQQPAPPVVDEVELRSVRVRGKEEQAAVVKVDGGLTLWPMLARDALMVWAGPALRRFASSDLYAASLVNPPIPYTASPLPDVVAPTSALMSHLTRHFPYLALSLLQHTHELLLTHTIEIDYTSPSPSSSSSTSVSSSSSTTPRTLLTRAIHVPGASTLVISFPSKPTLSPHTTLSFYALPHHHRLLYQLQGHPLPRPPPSALPPLSLYTNATFIHLSSSSSPSPSSTPSPEPPSELSLLISPISEHLAPALTLAHHLVAEARQGYSPSLSLLSALFAQCLDIAKLGGGGAGTWAMGGGEGGGRLVPGLVRVAVLKLAAEVVRVVGLGKLGSMEAALPLFREMAQGYREREVEGKGGERGGREGRGAGGERKKRPPPSHFSPVFHHLVELHCAFVEHFHPNLPHPAHPTPPVAPTFTTEEAEEKRKREEEDGRSSSDVALHADFRWPDWFVSACSAVLSMRGVEGGGVWALAKGKRRESALGVLSLESAALGGQQDVGEEDEEGEGRASVGGVRCLPLPVYEQLVVCMERRAEQLSRSPLQLTVEDLTGPEAASVFASSRALQSLPLPVLLLHATQLQTLNGLLTHALPLFDLSSPSSPLSISSLLCRCRALLFFTVKHAFFHDALTTSSSLSSSSSSGPLVVINRLRAAQASTPLALAVHHTARHTDTLTLISDSILGQSLSQLRSTPPSSLRRPRPRGGAPHTAFHVQFEGESVLGQGGPYRQLFNDVARELQASGGRGAVPLMVPTPNGRHGIGERRDLVMPNPAMRGVQQLQLFEHVGRLMGAACRTRLLLSLDLPSLFWKLLVDAKPDLTDLAQIDCALVDGLLTPASACETDEQFEAAFGSSSLTFPVTRSDGVCVDEGPVEAVTLATLPRWVREVEEVRLSEIRPQVEAVRRGMAALLPLSVLSLFSPSELARLFCGSASIDVALLQRHTEYSGGLSPSSLPVQWFWQVLREMTEAERRQFVAFAYAQERLPVDDAAFNAFPTTRMLLKASAMGNADVDHQLPHSDTWSPTHSTPTHTDTPSTPLPPALTHLCQPLFPYLVLLCRAASST